MNPIFQSSSLALLLVTFACGQGGGGDERPTPQDEQRAEETLVYEKAEYVAFLRPLNTRANGFINSGRADIKVDMKLAMTLVMDDAAGVIHVQSIHTGRRCPRREDDTNRDGYIDIIEALTVSGNILIPLDDDIEGQTLGNERNPIGRSYTYQRSGSMRKLLDDLFLPDEDLGDNVVKLRGRSRFSLAGRVILVHGVDQSAGLPTTVASLGGMPTAMSLPVACGRIVKK
jgi:hypothetical protein